MKKTRLFTLLLCVVMLLTSVSCVKDGGSTDTTVAIQTNDPAASSAPNGGETTAPAETANVDENGFLLDNLDPALGYNGEEFTLLYWSDREHEEFYVETVTGDLVSDALYNRNQAVEERLGIQFAYETEKGNGSNVTAFSQRVSNSIAAGDHAYDMVSAHSVTIGLCAAQNLLYDLHEVEHINYDMPWWPATLIDEATVNNKLLFASGDISANVIYMMYVTFFNKDLLATYKLEDPYELVNSGKWTLDKMISMCQDVYVDLNGNGNKDIGDQYGLYAFTLHTDAFLAGSNIISLDNADGTLVFTEDYLGEKTQSLQDKLQAFFRNTKGESLFWVDRCRQAIYFAAEELSYGIIPVPMYDEAQDGYDTLLGNPFSLYAIPKDSTTPDMAGAVMECMASESYRTVSPALYEVALKMKYSQDDVAAQMFDIAKSTVVFDLGRIFLRSLNAPYERWQSALTGNVAWMTTTKSMRGPWNKLLEKLLEIYE